MKVKKRRRGHDGPERLDVDTIKIMVSFKGEKVSKGGEALFGDIGLEKYFHWCTQNVFPLSWQIFFPAHDICHSVVFWLSLQLLRSHS